LVTVSLRLLLLFRTSERANGIEAALLRTARRISCFLPDLPTTPNIGTTFQHVLEQPPVPKAIRYWSVLKSPISPGFPIVKDKIKKKLGPIMEACNCAALCLGVTRRLVDVLVTCRRGMARYPKIPPPVR
jgi:hypothetical protein